MFLWWISLYKNIFNDKIMFLIWQINTWNKYSNGKDNIKLILFWNKINKLLKYLLKMIIKNSGYSKFFLNLKQLFYY